VFAIKRLYSTVFFFLFVFAVSIAAPAFASVSISVGTIEQFADGADIPITIYEDRIPVAVSFSFELYNGANLVSEGEASTDEDGEATISFSGLSSETYFTGEIWIGDYDDPEAFQTFSFTTDSVAGCSAGGLEWIGLLLTGLFMALKKHNESAPPAGDLEA
jgi:hypothetical protein